MEKAAEEEVKKLKENNNKSKKKKDPKPAKEKLIEEGKDVDQK